MRRLLLGLLAIAPLTAFAADPLVPLEHADIDVADQKALQRGASLFVNSCMGCHSVQYMRWDRVGRDIGITVDQLRDYLQTTGERPGDPMHIAMDPADGERWFGLAPPDLTLTARSRGPDWVYSFLLSFYVDDSKASGVNNLVFPDTAMPHVLADLQGLQRAVYRDGATDDDEPVIAGLELASEGSLSPDEYRRAARDITTFMSYLGEPAQLERHGLGAMVLLFLLIFFVFAFLLKREYWKDVH